MQNGLEILEAGVLLKEGQTLKDLYEDQFPYTRNMQTLW